MALPAAKSRARDGQPVKQQGQTDPPKRGEAAWRAHREAIASRNERASQRARARRREQDEQQLARQRAAELRERAELAKRAH